MDFSEWINHAMRLNKLVFSELYIYNLMKQRSTFYKEYWWVCEGWSRTEKGQTFSVKIVWKVTDSQYTLCYYSHLYSRYSILVNMFATLCAISYCQRIVSLCYVSKRMYHHHHLCVVIVVGSCVYFIAWYYGVNQQIHA